MADEKTTASTQEGTKSNTEVTQDPDQFFDGAAEEKANLEAEPPKGHATKGMTSLGYTEASRIEGTAAADEADRKAYEKAHAKES